MPSPQVTSPSDIEPGSPASTGDLVSHRHSSAPLVLPPALLETIRAQVNEGLRLVPRGGAEVGGLLVSPKGAGGSVRIERVVPVPIEYRFGPSFRLSPSDIANLEQAIASVPDSDLVVGFYRSRTRGEGQLRDSDLEISKAVERAHSSYAADFRFWMILTPVSRSAISVEIAECKDGAWGDWETYTVQSQMPDSLLDEAPPKKLQSLAHTPAVAVAPEARPAPVKPLPVPTPPPPTPAAPQATEPPSSRGWIYAATILLVLVVGAGTSWIYAHFRASAPVSLALPNPPRIEIGFAANPEGTLWKLTWNRDTLVALRPSGATLSIQDGDNNQQIPLTEADLASGTVFYTPQSMNLLFGFTVLTPGSRPVEEHVRVLSGIRPTPKPAEARVPIVSGGKTLQSQTRDRQGAAAEQQKTVRPFAGNRPSPVSPRVPIDMPPPPALPAVSGGTLSPSWLATTIPVEPPPAPTGARGISIEPAKIAPIPASVPPQRVLATPSPAPRNYTGPKPIRQVSPTTVASWLSGSTEVQVRVEIDAAGKVSKTTPIGLNATNFRLADASVHAARLWVFQPAKENGRPVPSTMILTFRFSGQ